MFFSKKLILQFFSTIFITLVFFILLNNLIINLFRTDMMFDLGWLNQPSGFALSENSLPYNPTNSYLWTLLVGLSNSLKVIFFGLILSTIIGVIAGASRFSSNKLIRILSSYYVIVIRQIPLLLQLLFWYFVAFLNLSNTPLSILGNILTISNQGVRLLGIDISVEFSALLIGLTIFTGASIAEVVRGGINSVSIGQWEAFRSLGIKDSLGMKRIVIPQALPAILPGLTSQYLNLAKNSTLAIAVGYPDIYAISDTTITQTGRAIEGFTILLIIFLILNLIISFAMEVLNKIILSKVYKY